MTKFEIQIKVSTPFHILTDYRCLLCSSLSLEIKRNSRGSRSQMLFKTSNLKNFVNFTGKTPVLETLL